jgi:hypothetical protein
MSSSEEDLLGSDMGDLDEQLQSAAANGADDGTDDDLFNTSVGGEALISSY